MLIKAAINGGRAKAQHAAVPVSPAELTAASVECLRAGANAIHLHVRSASGQESLYPDDVAQTLLAVLAVCPKSQIGVSTGAWMLPDTAARLDAIAAWDVLPGFASVNFGEDGATELGKLLLAKGVGVEAGLCDATAAEILLKSGLAGSCLRILIEPQEQTMEEALETVGAIEGVLKSVMVDSFPPLLLHGTEVTAWPMMGAAITRGYDLRIGLEDTVVLRDGRVARDNEELLGEAVGLVARSGQ